MYASQVEFLAVDVRLQVQQACGVGGGDDLGTGVYGELHFAARQFGGDGFEIGGEGQGAETAAGAFELWRSIHKLKVLRVAQKHTGLVVQRVVVQSLAVVDKQHTVRETVVDTGGAANVDKKIGDVVDALAELLIFDMESRVEIHLREHPSHIRYPCARGADNTLFARKLAHGLLAQLFSPVVVASFVQLLAARSLLQRVVGLNTQVVEDLNKVESGFGRKLVVGGRNHDIHFGVVHCANSLSDTKLFRRRKKCLFCKYTQKIVIHDTFLSEIRMLLDL